MKKQVITLTLIAVSIVYSSSVLADEQSYTSEQYKQPPAMKERPKLYDKDGNELTTPPKPGEEVYDKNGNKLERKGPAGDRQSQMRPKLYDKDGNELTTPPKPGDKVYDKNGNEITMTQKRPPRR